MKGNTKKQKRQQLLIPKRTARNKNGKKNVQKNRANHRNTSRPPKKKQSGQKNAMGNQIQLTAPHIFNLRKNRNEMLRFYDDLREAIARRRKVKILMDDIIDVSVGSVLYLVALLTDAGEKHILINGTVPRDRQCASIILASGFFDYVKATNPLPPPPKLKIAKITFYKEHNRQAIREFCKFTCGCIGKDVDNDSDPLYATLIELSLNTINHAFINKENKGNWYVAAEHLQEKNEVEVTFLDIGVGIPTTVKKRWITINRRWWENFLGVEDETLIMSALKGDLRTAIGEKNRGKGLPQIYEYYQNGSLRELEIASGKGYIVENNEIHLNNEFFGTLFSFKIGMEGNN